MDTMLFADFPDDAAADRAAEQLALVGYEPEEILRVSRTEHLERLRYIIPSSTRRDATEGMAIGAVSGMIVGLLASLLVASGTVSWLADIFFGGSLAALLGMAGVSALLFSGTFTGLVIGGILGLAMGLVPGTDDANYYQEAAETGATVLGVAAQPEDEPMVRRLLEDCQAGFIEGGAGYSAPGYNAYDLQTRAAGRPAETTQETYWQGVDEPSGRVRRMRYDEGKR
jgi:hypothetical protein